METTASVSVTNESQQQNLMLLEGPNVMQQALQTFRTDENSSNEIKQLLQQKQQQLQQLPTATAPAAAFPFLSANAAMSVPMSLSNHQQQMQWHQALQSFAAVQPPLPSSVPTATVTTPNTDSVNAAAAAAMAAAAVPFLASLTIPHLMQFNQQMQQPPPQPMVRNTPQLLTHTGSAVQPSEPPVSTSTSNTTKTGVSKITATKRKFQNNGAHDPGNASTGSTTTTTTKAKSQKRALARNNKTSSSIVSASVGSSSHNSSSGFGGTTISSSSSTLNNHPRTNGTTTSHYSHLNSSSSNGDNINNNIDGMDNLQPPQEKSAAILEKMTASERRRYDRNLREQQRSYRISQQIKELRDVLQQSNVPFRPNKYSILVSVAEYIQQLQGRAIMLDAEHERLIQTIRSTTEATTSGNHNNGNNNIGNGENGSSFTSNRNGTMDDAVAYRCNSHDSNMNADRHTTSHQDSLLFVPGIDYEAAFVHCPYPLGVATLDGRLIAANREFERLLNPNYTVVVTTKQHNPDSDLLFDGCTSMTSASSTNQTNTMIDQSFFVFIRNHQEIFEAMAALLKQSTASIERGEGTITNSPNLLFWHGQVVSSRNETYPFTITLTNTENDNPKYFNLSAARGA